MVHISQQIAYQWLRSQLDHKDTSQRESEFEGMRFILVALILVDKSE